MVPPTSTGSLIPFLFVVVLAAQALAERKTQKELNVEAVDNGRIFGGTATEAKWFRHQLYVNIEKDTYTALCGGSIISLTWSMSAAHCFAEEKPNATEGFIITAKKIYLYAGVTDKSKVGSDLDVQSKIFDESDFEKHLFVHQEYKIGGRFNNDIAIIKLKEPWNPTKTVFPIALANSDDFVVGRQLTVSGWGKTCGYCGVSNILLYAENLTLISQDECTAYWGSELVTDKMICHKTEDKNVCQGDSGGPLITGTWRDYSVQIGIVSWGSKYCNAPAVFVDVAKFTNWIDDTIVDNSVPSTCREGFFSTTGSEQCYKFLNDTPYKTWTEAKKRCESENLMLAEPRNPVAVRIHILANYDGLTWSRGWAWLGARGDGSSLRWQHGGQTIDNNSSLWYYPGQTVNRTSNDYCLMLMSRDGSQYWNPVNPYFSHLCDSDIQYGYPLCEAVPSTCPEGFFSTAGSTKCYKFINDIKYKNWTDAKKRCDDENLQLAEPEDPVAVRSHVIATYGPDQEWAWLGARGDGSSFKWQHGGQAIDNNSPNWYPGHPRNRTTHNFCLMLMTYGPNQQNYPTRPYISQYCSDYWFGYTLCEIPGTNTNPKNCEDENSKCPKWAAQGKCSKGKFYWKCKTSCACGKNSIPCKDKSNKCPKWEEQGKCTKKKIFYKCKSSCACGKVSIPAGFEEFNGRIIRRTKINDTKGNYDDAMSYCDQFGAKPFIPLTDADYQLYKEVRESTSNQHIWLPANDRLQEGTLRWYNGEVASNITLWNWYNDQELYANRESLDCLLYGYSSVTDDLRVHLLHCDRTGYLPPICEKM